MNLKPIFKTAWNWSKRNSSKILAAGAIVAEIMGFYFMHKEAPIVHDRLEALPENAKWTDKVKAAGPVYLPAIGMLMLSSGCMITSVAMGERKAAVMASLYSASEASLRRLEKKISEELEEGKAKKIRGAVAQEMLDEHEMNPMEVELTGKGNTLFLEPWTGKYFRSSLDAVKNDVADYNNFVSSQCWATFNDFCDYLGIRNAACGEFVGFNLDHKIIVSYVEGSEPNTKELCWVMHYFENPVTYNGKPPRYFRECENCYIE